MSSRRPHAGMTWSGATAVTMRPNPAAKPIYQPFRRVQVDTRHPSDPRARRTRMAQPHRTRKT